MPEIIGDTGYIVSRNTEQISQLLIKMPNEKSDLQIAAHRRIIANFSLHTRKEILITRISNILTQNT